MDPMVSVLCRETVPQLIYQLRKQAHAIESLTDSVKSLQDALERMRKEEDELYRRRMEGQNAYMEAIIADAEKLIGTIKKEVS